MKVIGLYVSVLLATTIAAGTGCATESAEEEVGSNTDGLTATKAELAGSILSKSNGIKMSCKVRSGSATAFQEIARRQHLECQAESKVASNGFEPDTSVKISCTSTQVGRTNTYDIGDGETLVCITIVVSGCSTPSLNGPYTRCDIF